MTLSQQSQIAVSPDNSVFLLADNREALFVLRTGKTAPRRIGRKGTGPGEYQRILSFGWLADTLWLSDTGNRRLTFIDRYGGGKLRTESFIGGMTADAFTSMPLSLTTQGHALSVLQSSYGGQNRMTAAIVEPLVRVSRERRSSWDTLMLLDIRHRNHRVLIAKGNINGRALMSDATLWTISRNGDFVLSVDRSDDAATKLRPVKVLLQSTKRRRIYEVEFQNPRQRVTRADVDKLVQNDVDAFNLANRTDWVPKLTADQYRSSMFVPIYRIHFTDAVVGDDGTVLLRGNDWSGINVSYTWILPNGTIRGSLAVPVSQYIRAVTSNEIWSIEERPNGEHRLIRQFVTGS
ncbi:MAG: hypothetical protein H7Z40_01890 [Phycisphaerae bacterium]|nr:hypothetical protein [Gemmatimonadaceae bacterium]